jgi:release factor glutamine methyltransferase
MTDRDQHSDRPRLADLRDVETVYGPAEDSRLLAEAVVEHATAGDRVLDLGTGSGYVGLRIRRETGADVVGSDLNPAACRRAAGEGLPVVRADMFGPFRSGSFDVVCCNPPYLPTPPEQEWGDWMERALSGGPEGRAVVDPFLAGVDRVLAPGGEALLLVSTLTGLAEVRETATAAGLDANIVAEESHPFERLVVFRLVVSDP